MKHPLIGKNSIYYALAWVILTMVHAFAVYSYFNLLFAQALLDALFFNILIASVGLSLWWTVQYLNPNRQGVFGTIIAYVFLTLIGVSAIQYLTDLLSIYVAADQESVTKFLQMAKPWKLLVGSLYIGIIILIYYLIIHTSSLQAKEEKEISLQGMLKQAELDMLRFQINPHFIFNSLNSISALTITEPEQAREMVIKLSDFLRGALGKDQAQLHSLKEELSQMNNYLEIEKVRFGERLKVNMKKDEKLDNWPVPNMILQPLYENVIKYGVNENLDEVRLDTLFSQENDCLVVRVKNNYDSTAAMKKGKGIGLNNVRSRLELIYGIPDLVTIERDKSTFCVKLEIPAKPVR